MKWALLFFSLAAIHSPMQQQISIDLSEMVSDIVLEAKRLEIPGYSSAFNPSIVRWRGAILMSFKIIPNPKDSFVSYIGLIWLDDQLSPIGEPQILDTREHSPSIPSRSEDARLIAIGERLFMVYSDCVEPKVSKGGFRVYLAELVYERGAFHVKNPECLCSFDGESKEKREKNWVPFEYQGELLLAYSLEPHLIFHPLIGLEKTKTLFETKSGAAWDWGELRGGTPAIRIDGEYLALFHSSKSLSSTYSDGKIMAHYFMGAYTYSAEPPFAIKKLSRTPIVGADFYRGPVYKPYWSPVRVVFPCGLIEDGEDLWISYGRQDREVWVARLDKKKLLSSLVPLR